MQIDKHQFSDNIILPTDKKVLVPPEVSDKDKRKNIIIGDPHTPNISQGVVTQKALDKGIIKTGGATSKYGRTTDQRSLSCASRTVRHLRSDSPEPARTVWRTQPDVSAAARGHNIHTHWSPNNQKRMRRGKAHIKHLVSWSKPTLLLIDYSPNMLTRRSLHMISQRRNPDHPRKQHCWLKRSKRRHNQCHIFIHI
jgi:hypothetical protein